jgi:amino-acid N-acetyltransferase
MSPAQAGVSLLEPAISGRARPASGGPAAAVRAAGPSDAGAIHGLIEAHRVEGRLLPRRLEEIHANAHRFVVAVAEDALVGCADLAPLGSGVAEIRSLVVRGEARGQGIGQRLIGELVRRASRTGIERVCAFTHAPRHFVRAGFSIVPHTWLPEKIQADCHHCQQFRRCGQHAVILSCPR